MNKSKEQLLEQRSKQLNQEYVDSLSEKIQHIESLWWGLVKHELEAADVKLLYQAVHSLNGSGATFGYVFLSEMAEVIEILLKPLMQDNVLPNVEQQSHISKLLIKLRKAALEPKGYAIRHDLVTPAQRKVDAAKKEVVFIVDNDEVIAKTLAEKLEQYNYASEIFLSLDFIKQKVVDSAPVAIIMDIDFSEGELVGIDIITDIKRSQLIPVPVIFISVRDDMAAHLSAVRAGASHYLSKPVNSNHLISLLNDLTEKVKDEPYRVMIVDDDTVLARRFALALEHAGLDTRIVSNPMTVLDELKSYQPELILMDVYMPDCSGLELAMITRQFPEYVDVPILFLSAETNFDKQLAALDMGGDDFLSKPIDPRHLVNAVLARVKRYRKTNQLSKNLRASVSRLGLSEKRLSQIINTSTAAIYTLQMSGNEFAPMKVTMMSDSAEAICGYEANNWVDKESFWSDLIFEDDKNEVLTLVKGLIKQGHIELEYRVMHRDGHPVWVHENLTVLLDRQGELVEIIGSRMDVSARKEHEIQRIKLEEQMRQTYKMEAIGLLTGGIAHDFNNILASILGYTNLASMRGDFPENSKMPEYLQQISKASERGRLLTTQMLSFCRNTPTAISCIQVEPLITETIKLLKSTLPSSIEIFVDVDTDLPNILMDPTQLHQLMMNLCVNAKDAMQGKGKLIIKLKLMTVINAVCTTCKQPIEGQYIVLSIEDTGEGISKENLEKVFDLFYTTKAVGKGSGMGLSIVHGAVHQNQGHIDVDSIEDKGSVFKLYFSPQLEKQGLQPDLSAQLVDLYQGQGESILVVDDEEGIVELLKDALESVNYNVTASVSSVDALAVFEANPAQFDLLISDQTMPIITGDVLIKRCHQINPELPAILCTGYSEEVDPGRAKELGIERFFYKPYRLNDLLEAVFDVLNKKTHALGERK